ncbi:MAG: hypothetical protein WCK34_00755 [Bacteroidota bacterium]
MRHDYINTLQQVNSLIVNTYIFAIVVALLCVGLSILVAKMIAYQGGAQDHSFIIRRIMFIIIWAVSFIGFFLYENFVETDRIRNIAFQSRFRTCIAISCLIIVVLYGVAGFLIMKFFRKSKYGSILGRMK